MKTIKLIVLAQLIILGVYAQTDSLGQSKRNILGVNARKDSLLQLKRKKSIFYIHMTQLLVGEYQVTYERNVSRRLSMGLSVGFKTGAGALISSNLFPIISSSNTFSLINKNLNSIYYSNYLKLFLSKPWRKSDFYICFEPFTRITWGDIYYDQSFISDGKILIGKQKIHKDIFEAGLKVLFGHNFKPVKLSPNLGICFNLFYGFSVRYKFINDTYYKFSRDDYTVNDIDKIEFSNETYDQDVYKIPFSMIHFGLKMGLGWGKVNY